MIELKRANGFGWMALFLTNIQTGVVISPIMKIMRIAFLRKGPVNGLIWTALNTTRLIFVKHQLLKTKSGTRSPR